MLKSKFKRITISGKTKIVSKIDHLKILRNEWLLAYGIANGRKISVSHFLILLTSSLSLQLFYIYVCVCFFSDACVFVLLSVLLDSLSKRAKRLSKLVKVWRHFNNHRAIILRRKFFWPVNEKKYVFKNWIFKNDNNGENTII